jgi:hypothetical protein
MDSEFQRLAEIEVDAVRPEQQGFTLTGQGPDRAEYRLDVHFDMPLDARTRAVLGELLSHSGLTISRRGKAPAPRPRARRDGAHRP